MAATIVNLASKRATNVTESFVPEKNETYVPFGFFNDMKNIIKSKIFYPIYITGLSGNGKTFMIEQVCAALNRELIRVNITKRTDETDLIGSYELIDGSTHIVGQIGTDPYIAAFEAGAQVVIAGRSCDTAIYAALPIWRGFDPGLALHMSKIMECGAQCGIPLAPNDCLMGNTSLSTVLGRPITVSP